MSPERFDHLLSIVGPHITREDTNFRKSIAANERLAITLRFLASMESQQSLSYSYRVGRSTISNIVRETCKVIYDGLAPTYLKAPSLADDWLAISKEFEEVWNMPHVIGAIDGKHVRIQCPKKSGTLYHNYKGFFSLVIMAVCDARYCFSLVDVGHYGSNNDSGILQNSKIGRMFSEGEMNVPAPSTVNGCDFDPLPYYMVGDEIFPLKTWLMRPYPGRLTEEQRIFNYRLSRARRVIENTFGILVARWRIFHTPIISSIENAERYVRAAITLHNYLRLSENARYCPNGFTDSESSSGNVVLGEWRRESCSSSKGCLMPLNNVRGSRYREDAVNMQECLKAYLNSDLGEVEWQLDYVRRT